MNSFPELNSIAMSIKYIFIILVLSCLFLANCSKKSNDPNPDFISTWIGTYIGTNFTAIVSQKSEYQANVSIFPNLGPTTNPNLNFIITHSKTEDLDSTNYKFKSSYFTMPTVSSSSVNIYGSKYIDYQPQIVVYQNIKFLFNVYTIPSYISNLQTINGYTYFENSLYLHANDTDNTDFTGKYSR